MFQRGTFSMHNREYVLNPMVRTDRPRSTSQGNRDESASQRGNRAARYRRSAGATQGQGNDSLLTSADILCNFIQSMFSQSHKEL